MKKNIIIIILFFACSVSNAQKEASNWFFGDFAGLSFNLDANTLNALSGGQLSTDEGCASISDGDGNLQFYTDGRTVYDANNNIMPNGTGLKGDSSSTQSAIIIPKPNDPDIYYIFTVDTPSLDNIDLGLHFYEVNMTLNGGLGDVVGNSETQLLGDTTEKLSAVLKDCQSENVWVITLVLGNGFNTENQFYAYEVTSSGVITTPIISPSGTFFNEIRGYLKFSPSGDKLASANVGDGLFLYDFDKTTGSVTSAPQNININFTTPNGNGQRPYGIEFSPNNNLLYVSTFFSNGSINNADAQYGALFQYDISSNDINTINASQVLLDDRQTYRGGLQLGPDRKIYRAMSDTYNNGNNFLSVINNPNEVGLACNYQHGVIALTANSRQGLPPFITSFFSEDIDIIQNGNSTTDLPLCIGENYTLTAENITGATYIWTRDGVELTDTNFDLVVNSPGVYRVTISLSSDTCGFLEGEANVTYFDIPVANPVQDIEACGDDNNNVFSFNLQSQTNTILNGQDATQFSVNYFESMADAMANTNAIEGNYQNTANPQQIVARIQNTGNPNCFDTTSFNIRVFDTPVITSVADFINCDNDTNPTDGQTMIVLSSFNSNILGTQNASAFTISYHTNQDDANNDVNSLPNNYTNQSPFNETIIVRIDNNANENCFSTTSINLTIKPLPEAFNTEIYQCDEQNMVDGFTIFNLTEANPVITNGAPDRTTQFYLTLNDAQNDTNEVNASAFSNTINPQTITVKVIDTITGCFSYSELILETSDTQISNYNADPVCDELGSEDGKNTFNLNDFSTQILSGLPAGLNIFYYETYNDALLENNVLATSYQNTTPYNQTIFVRVENDNACYGINEVNLTINPLPSLEDDETIIYCLNEFPTLVTLNAGLNDIASNYTFSWSTLEATQTIEVNDIGTYTVTVTNSNTFCSKTKTIIIEPSNIATIENIEIIDGSLSNNLVTVLVSGEGDYQYALTDQEGNMSSFQASNVFNNLSPGIYSVTVRDIKNNCGATNQDISVIGFPLFFTPNGDTFNDTWQVYGVSNLFQPNSEILIFDRFGKLITQISPSGFGWDGTYNGKPLPQSDYWFSVKLQDGRIYKNHFTLKR